MFWSSCPTSYLISEGMRSLKQINYPRINLKITLACYNRQDMTWSGWDSRTVCWCESGTIPLQNPWWSEWDKITIPYKVEFFRDFMGPKAKYQTHHAEYQTFWMQSLTASWIWQNYVIILASQTFWGKLVFSCWQHWISTIYFLCTMVSCDRL